MKTLMLALTLAAAYVTPCRTGAQALFGTRLFHLDSLEIGAAARSSWRGIELGHAGVRGAANVALWQILEQKLAVTGRAFAEFPLARHDDRARTTLTELAGGLTLSFADEGQLSALVESWRMRASGASTTTNEIALHAQRDFLHFRGTERNLLWSLTVARDLDHASTYIEPGVSWDLGIHGHDAAANGVSGCLEFHPSWTMASTGGTRRTRPQASRAGVCAALDRRESFLGPLAAELRVGYQWSSVDDGADGIVAGVRVVLKDLFHR